MEQKGDSDLSSTIVRWHKNCARLFGIYPYPVGSNYYSDKSKAWQVWPLHTM